MFPEWHHAVPELAYFKVPETLKTFRMYQISRSVYVLHWLATRLSYTSQYPNHSSEYRSIVSYIIRVQHERSGRGLVVRVSDSGL